jgi:glutaminase
MKMPISDYLVEILTVCRQDSGGELADYIPELAEADRDAFGVCLATVDGPSYAAGDADVAFTIQSISKAFVYALAIFDRGLDAVLERVGVEPSGEAFNELSLEGGSGRPRNPMINAGAITAHSLVGDVGADGEGRFRRILDGLSAFAGRSLAVDEVVFASEMDVADRNLAIAHMLRSYGLIESDPSELVHWYIRQCSVEVTTNDLAAMAATLANGGVQPVTGERIVSATCARQVLSVMTTCGMYDGAGDWVSSVGIPAKSGVAGGIIGALPGQVGIATYSPPLDPHGNSVRGVRVCQRLSGDMGLHLMEAASPARSVLRTIAAIDDRDGIAVRLYELQGTIQFASAESVLRAVVEDAAPEPHVAFDLSRVHAVDDVGRRMLLEAVRRLAAEGRSVTLIDPDVVLGDRVAGDGLRASVVTSRSALTGR